MTNALRVWDSLSVAYDDDYTTALPADANASEKSIDLTILHRCRSR
jgi:hypothetical protein